MATTNFTTFDFDPNTPEDAAEVELQNMVARRVKAGKTLEFRIDDFGDFISCLQNEIAINLKKKARFITEIYIWGHGEPGRFKFGGEYIGAKELKTRGSGIGSEHIVPFSTIYLKGCNAAAGEAGKEFLYQLGRVVFGGIPGYLWGNTRPVRDLLGVDQSSTGAPVEYTYPDDFKNRCWTK